MTPRKVTIVGAGLGGALMACLLGREGYEVEVYEKRPDPRQTRPEPGRSINLALSYRGLCALEEAGLREEALRIALPMRGRMMHAMDGSLSFQPYGTDPGHQNYSITRSDLNLLLVEAARRCPGMTFHFGARCVGLDTEAGTLDIEDVAGGRRRAVPAGAVIASDGAFSAVRARLMRLDRFDYSQEHLGHGYKELTMPPGEGGRFRMEESALHIWPRRTFMMIALPNPDKTFTCTLFWPFEGEGSFAALRTESQVLEFFRSTFPDSVPLIPDLASQFLTAPTGSMVTVRCSPWHWRDKVVLLGDACHAVVPFYGQGMNAAFEDCVVLADCLKRHPDLGAAFASFQALRKPSLDALAELAVENFVEMRDKVASPVFLLKKKMEHVLHKLLPWAYSPLYMMVTYTRMPYHEARRRARLQDRVLALSCGIFLLSLWIVLSRL